MLFITVINLMKYNMFSLAKGSLEVTHS